MPNGFKGDPPIVTAIVACEQANVSLDSSSKLSLIGLFDVLSTPQLPLAYLVTIYTAVTGFVEPFLLSMRTIRPSDGLTSTGTLFGEQEINAQASPSDTSQVVLQGVYTFDDFGRYDVQVYGNGAFLASRAIFVRNLLVVN